VWSSKPVNTRNPASAGRLPHEAVPPWRDAHRAARVPQGGKLPATALLRNAHGIAEWKLFLNE
jgi:hypothetical protein